MIDGCSVGGPVIERGIEDGRSSPRSSRMLSGRSRRTSFGSTTARRATGSSSSVESMRRAALLLLFLASLATLRSWAKKKKATIRARPPTNASESNQSRNAMRMRITRTRMLLALTGVFVVTSGCGSSNDESADGNGGKNTGGASGASSGGTAGTASGGSSGTASGGSAGASSGGSAGAASGGSAGVSSGGGGTGGAGGGSGGWGCTETATTCACSPTNPSAQSNCQGSFSCCYLFKQECDCLDLPSQQCDQTIKSLKASKVPTCPP